MNILNDAPLGKKTPYVSHYQRDLLFPLARITNRTKLGLSASLPFKGVDIWNAYELSWLNSKGKPVVALGEFIFPCESPYLIEAKSLKLYLNSFNNTSFASLDEVIAILEQDLTNALGERAHVCVRLAEQFAPITTKTFHGICLDSLDITCDTYLVNPNLLKTEDETVISEIVYSDLLKSNCLMTEQPDWGSIQISYTGKKIQHTGLLKYIISFRNHNEFGEQCAERIFMDIMNHCSPRQLSVYVRYTRRGGIDINAYRSTENNQTPDNIRLCRQ